MAADVVPALTEAIQKGFDERVSRDGKIKQVSNRVRDGTATFMDSHTYAERLGTALSNSLIANITTETLPNGELYYNIANRIIPDFLQSVYDSVNENAEDVQAILDAQTGIGIKAVKAVFPEERIRGLIEKLTDPDEDIEERLKWFGEPIVNNSEAFFDDYVAENAKTRAELGLHTTITRIVSPGCCPWCAALDGTYEYGEEPKDIYRRHEHCRCEVIYQSDRGYSENVWSKERR